MSARDRVEAALERLVRASATERFLISAAALLLSMLVGTVIVLAAGRMTTCAPGTGVHYFGVGFCYDPARVYDRLFLGALGNPINPYFDPLHGQFAPPIQRGWSPLNPKVARTLAETTILVFTGLSVAVAFRAGIFNIGTQGQLIAGGLASVLAMLAVAPALSGLVGGAAGTFVATTLILLVGLLVGALFGGLYGAIPGILKAYADANEVITTIMLNFVASLLALYLVGNHFKDPEALATKTRDLPAFAGFADTLFGYSRFSIFALLVALALVGGIYYLLGHTAYGFDLRTSGIQPEAAEYGGVDAKRTIVSSMTLSGALGGVGGMVYAVMFFGYFQTPIPAYGFDGITVSILAGNNPLGVIPAAFLFGLLKSGTLAIQLDTALDVPVELVGILRGLIILFVAMPEFFRIVGQRVVDLDPARPVATDGGDRDGGASDE
ncbi:ABC transporter permease [Halomarina pelagica]|uniref:ABC transporter permease n=1 Tax=Halomarina pelagica TaxID=2961599 RepID=UPI0020C3AE45|nr:ABC transporter permease [Halomarina sp. BND7]